MQFNKEFEMIQPKARDFFHQYAQLAPGIVSYAEKKTDNAVVRALLQELENGGEGQCAATNFKPPQCVYQQYCLALCCVSAA